MSGHKPRVSIGLPVFNGEKYLAEAIDSILVQTYSDFELIISDNASTDRTPEICQVCAANDARIRYYRNSKNLGASPNFNRVFEWSSGEYFRWAAHDDLIASDFLARCVAVLDQNPETVLCYPKATAIDENGMFLDIYDPRPDTSSPRPHERFRNLILSPHMALQIFGLIRASALRKTSLMGNYPSSDEVLLAELALLGRFYEVPNRLFLTRIHPGQSTKGAFQIQRTRIIWFDTSREGRIVLPTWRYFGECLRAINRVPQIPLERISCYLHMGRWLMNPHHLRAMGKDLLIAASQTVCSVLFRLRGHGTCAGPGRERC